MNTDEGCVAIGRDTKRYVCHYIFIITHVLQHQIRSPVYITSYMRPHILIFVYAVHNYELERRYDRYWNPLFAGDKNRCVCLYLLYTQYSI
jgi:hypothetical protein